MSCQSTTSYTKILSLNSASFILGRFVSTLCLIFPFFFFFVTLYLLKQDFKKEADSLGVVA